MFLKHSQKLGKLAFAAAFFSAALQARPALEPAGLAAYTETARDIYVAGLLLAPGTGMDNIYLAPGPKEMEYRIATRRISSRGFSGTLLLQAELGSGQRAPQNVIDVIGELKGSIKGALVRGDQFVISLSADDATTFYLNGTELLTVDDGSIFDFFFAGWVGENSTSILRDNLLAGTIDPAVKSRYSNLKPAARRVQTTASWMEPEPAPAELAPVAVASAPAQVAAVSMEASAPAAAAAPKAAIDATTDIDLIVVSAEPMAEAEFEPAGDGEQAGEAVQVAMATSAPILDIDDRDYQLQVASYVSEVMTAVFSQVKYPRRAVKREREGKVDLLATLSQTGELEMLTVEETSGHKILDEAAFKAVSEAAPFPELTAVVREEFLSEDGTSYQVMIPVTFRLN